MIKNVWFFCLSMAMISAAVGFLAPGFSTVLAQREKLASKNDHYWGYSELAKAPEKARAKRNPFEGDTDAVAAGKKLFEQHCEECHGDAAQGGRKGPSLRSEEVRQAAPGTLFWILTNGVVRRGMPVWSKLPEPQRWQLVTYIKSLDSSEKLPDRHARISQQPLP